ncbi:PLP-dependent aminotransferase family protein [Fluviibacterium sp. S390]|uniref:MocR-like pyridoxine biosynthesis transcription factor PdxR n=1 Tax=Fluviibacterium sp. S390 TaxID=3415139 RepID=UPI003C7A6EAA
MATISEQTFFLDPDFEGTLQQQLQHMVTSAILSGRLKPGDKLPSSRKLAAHLGISRITVTLAYTELLANDYLTSRGRSGYYVSLSAPRPPAFDLPRAGSEDRVDWSRALGQKFSAYAPVHRPPDWRRYPYPFIYGQTDPTLFDHRNWRVCAMQALGQRDFEALTADYYERDDPKLVEYILRHILPRRGITARPEEVLVTLGAQNALWIAAQILLTQRRLAAFENPCYPGLREILNQTRCKTLAVDVDTDGLDPDALSDEVDAVFTTPSHQCPTNATLPLERRMALLDRAEADNFLVVEDDYEFEMSFLDTPSPALKSLDRNGRVIYIGSFSKSLFPGLRLGYLVGSEPFIREARALRALVLRHPPGHLQRTAAYFLSQGHYDSQIKRMGLAYGERRVVMDQAIRAHGLTLAGTEQFGGSSFWMTTPEGIGSRALAQELLDHGVLIEPGRAFFAPDAPDDRHYRLAYSSIPADRIAEGIARLAQALDRLQPGTGQSQHTPAPISH